MNAVQDHKKYQLLLILLISFFLALTFPGLAKADTDTATTGAANTATVSTQTASPAPAASEATGSVKACTQAAGVANDVPNSGNATSSLSPSEDNKPSLSPAEKVLEKASPDAQRPASPANPEPPLTPDNGDKSSPLEIGGEVVPPPVAGGGSSGGGGGGMSVLSSIFPPGFSIVKVSKDGQKPMKVAFRITNLYKDESHIVVTDENGRVNGIILAETFDFYTSIQSDRMPHSSYYNDREKKKPDLYGRGPDAPKILGSWPDSPKEADSTEIDLHANRNDDFKECFPKDKPNSNEPFKYKDFYKNDRVIFTKKYTSSKPLTLTVSYQLENSQWDETTGNKTIIPLTERYTFTEQVNADKFKRNVFLQELDDFLSAQVDLFNEDPSDGRTKANAYSYTVSLMDNDRPKYLVEELRTDTNLNHNLKTFYLQPGDIKEIGNKPSLCVQEIKMGNSEDQITNSLLPDVSSMHPPLPPEPSPGSSINPPPPPEPLPPSPLEPSPGSSINPPPPPEPPSDSSMDPPLPPPMLPFPIITIENEKFDFKTLATHGSGAAKTFKKSTITVIQDKITYDNFSIGYTYEFVGRLVHKKDGKEAKIVKTFNHKTKELTASKGEIVLNISFDSTPFQAGDEFVLLYDIYENGILVGKEDNLNNAAQTISLMSTPPPGRPPSPSTQIIRVTKVWDLAGHENPVGEIIVELYRDGQATGERLKLNAANNWTGSFTGLEIVDKTDSARKYQYTIREVGDVNGLFESDGKKFEVSYTGDMSTGFTITNKEIPEKPPQPPETPEEPPVTPPETPEEPPVTPPETPEEPPVVPQTPPTVPEAPGKAPQTGLPANGAPILLIALGLVGLRLTRRRKRTDGQ